MGSVLRFVNEVGKTPGVDRSHQRRRSCCWRLDLDRSPVIAALFIFGTGAVLAVVDPAEVDLVSPVLQAISVAARPLILTAYLASSFFVLLLISRLAQSSINFALNSRLPMVAGWDHLLPVWFTRLHPTRRTPVNSALFVAALTLALALAVIAGAGRQEAFQLLT